MPDPVTTTKPAPRANARPGVHADMPPAELVQRFPGVHYTRVFLGGVQSAPGSLVGRLERLCRPSWDAGLCPVWSLKLNRAQVMRGQWDRHIAEAAEWCAGQPASEAVPWHEPENDPEMCGGAFPLYFNRIARVWRLHNDTTPLLYASMAYQWLPRSSGVGRSVKGNTDRVTDWTGCRADRFTTDVYSGASVPLGTILPEHTGVRRWLSAVVGSTAPWGVTERGWLRPAAKPLTSTERDIRVLTIGREIGWLTGDDPAARRVTQWIAWNTPGAEDNPNLVLEAAAVPSLARAVAELAHANARAAG